MATQSKYDEHLGFLIKQEMGSRAELQGFRDAKVMYDLLGDTESRARKLPLYSNEPFEQARYVLGFQDGNTILTLEKAS